MPEASIKVVDSDDWVDVPALHKALDKLRQFVRDNKLGGHDGVQLCL